MFEISVAEVTVNAPLDEHDTGIPVQRGKGLELFPHGCRIELGERHIPDPLGHGAMDRVRLAESLPEAAGLACAIYEIDQVDIAFCCAITCWCSSI